jgi:hypothetical protein
MIIIGLVMPIKAGINDKLSVKYGMIMIPRVLIHILYLKFNNH